MPRAYTVFFQVFMPRAYIVFFQILVRGVVGAVAARMPPLPIITCFRTQRLICAPLPSCCAFLQAFASLTITAHAGRSSALPILQGEVPIPEAAVWTNNAEFVRKSLDIPHVSVVDVVVDPAAATADPTGKAKDVVPGEPVVHAYVVA